MAKRDEGIPQSFTDMVRSIEDYALEQIAEEVRKKKLYYHTIDHALAVKRRANQIFKAIQPTIKSYPDFSSEKRFFSLINIVATAHDMVQDFKPSTVKYKPRSKILGVSEHKTITKLINYIRELNKKILAINKDRSIVLNDGEIDIIRESITATICQYDTHPYSIYQRDLYDSEKKLSLISRIIALADLGTLGMEGVETYLKESILVFLEDNPDLIPYLIANENLSLEQTSNLNTPIQEQSIELNNLKSILLNLGNFIVNFAAERYNRFEFETSTFPEETRQILRTEVFKYMQPKTIDRIENIIPKNKNISLTKLLEFFDFEKYIQSIE